MKQLDYKFGISFNQFFTWFVSQLVGYRPSTSQLLHTPHVSFLPLGQPELGRQNIDKPVGAKIYYAISVHLICVFQTIKTLYFDGCTCRKRGRCLVLGRSKHDVRVHDSVCSSSTLSGVYVRHAIGSPHEAQRMCDYADRGIWTRRAESESEERCALMHPCVLDMIAYFHGGQVGGQFWRTGKRRLPRNLTTHRMYEYTTSDCYVRSVRFLPNRT